MVLITLVSLRTGRLKNWKPGAWQSGNNALPATRV
jgi:hypothetical protein